MNNKGGTLHCKECLEAFEFRDRINKPVKHKTKYHLKYHSWIGQLVWMITELIPTTIKNGFTWAWFREYEGQFSWYYLVRPIRGWKLAYEIAYYCKETSGKILEGDLKIF